ncbi:hypothetical protein bplSymb_SCF17701P002 [Bathymodiolus platifrons methanotrophic gill symbiont]|uniref:hypothetical protein n=1 Tax=Bathymodiolus platifrons methanotrophic gill symbiont TaxID=113268 RepID=UPI000B41F7FD|nr:hypothetical protein [Bathymodiolus platifrons methanotrophic gill symbiont]GAW87797.1 hypothetical protein bplSymb_SCF17701P002 [Bathymodiolus platifrons methanotrophic gill symbiont]
MTNPYSLETIISELGDKADAWVLQDTTTGSYVTIPHPKYPGRQIIHFFMSKSDAQDVLVEILDTSDTLKDKEIYPTKINISSAMEGIAAGKDNPLNADGFVVHSPNEVREFLGSRSNSEN